MASGSWFVGAVPKGGPLVGIPLAGGPLFAAALFTEFAAGSPRGSPYDCGPWDRGGLRTADCDLRTAFSQDSGGAVARRLLPS